MEKIIVHYDYPPIPYRGWDYSAVRDSYEPGNYIGSGSTAVEAIRDLLEQEEENE